MQIKENVMTTLATCVRSGQISRIVMGDGKANVMSLAMLQSLHAAFDAAERDKTVVILSARGKHFSAGFDLNVFATGTAQDVYAMLKAGAELALRILSFPMPVVAACQGNAFPMGAFLILASDYRVAADGEYRIGLNEVAIGLTVPGFAIELARQRLAPAYFNRVSNGEMFGPAEAVVAGYVDRVVPAAELDAAAQAAADHFTKLDPASHAATKLRIRDGAVKAMRAAIDSDITIGYAEQRAASRAAAM
jgi:enoyl-CoA hydratase